MSNLPEGTDSDADRAPSKRIVSMAPARGWWSVACTGFGELHHPLRVAVWALLESGDVVPMVAGRRALGFTSSRAVLTEHDWCPECDDKILGDGKETWRRVKRKAGEAA